MTSQKKKDEAPQFASEIEPEANPDGIDPVVAAQRKRVEARKARRQALQLEGSPEVAGRLEGALKAVDRDAVNKHKAADVVARKLAQKQRKQAGSS
jgi:hypothetical protein